VEVNKWEGILAFHELLIANSVSRIGFNASSLAITFRIYENKHGAQV
jgi:hypothetical protein